MTTLQTPWTGGALAARSRRRQRVAAVIAVLLVAALAGSGIVLLDAAGSQGSPAARPPEPDVAAPAVPGDDLFEARPDIPPPADHWADEGVVPPERAPDVRDEAPPQEAVEPPAAPAPNEPVADERTSGPPVAEEPIEEPAPAEPAPAEPAPAEPAPAPDPIDLVAVQRRLQELGYLLGPADGVKGQQTVAAVMAFQRVNGLSVDGVVGPKTLAALESPLSPQLRGGPDTRIEVDLTRQLAHVVRDGTRVVTLHISSGNGEAYRGGTAYGRTPVGDFRVERRIHGERHAELGILYDPLYFHRGYAIHGSNSVPNHPASHGCVRVTRADARWLIANIADGTPVQLHGGTHVFTPSR
jgi:lipoprotein-anchoring transpeptidase ErfK/SrfK